MAHYHILIFAGQSNMEGFGATGGLPLASADSPFASYALPAVGTFPALYYQTNTTADLSAFKSYPLQDSSIYGPELACCWKYKAAYPERNLCVLKVAFGGSSALDWFGTGTGEGWAGDVLFDVITQAKALLDAAGHTYTWDALFWWQGETGAQDCFKQLVDPSLGDANYITPTLAGFTAIRAATSSSLKIVVGRIGDHMATPEYLAAAAASNGETDPRDGLEYDEADFLAALQYRWAQQAEIVASTTNSVLVNMDGFSNRTVPPDPDSIHIPDDEYLAAGERFFDNGYQALASPRTLVISAGGLVLPIAVA